MSRFNVWSARGVSALALAAAALIAETAPVSAQYFGRNKVQYRSFDFELLRTEHFDVYFYPEEAEAARDGARMAERWYDRLSGILDHEFEERQPFIFYASHPHFQQTNTSWSAIGEGTGGFTEAFKQRVVMPFSYSFEETDRIVGHELVHAFQYDISGVGRAGGGIEHAARRYQVPLWFSEGMAEYLAVGPIDPHTAMWVRDAALRGEIPSIERMTYDPRIFPYRWGQALWSYIGGRWGDVAVGQILKLAGQGVPFPEAFERILNLELEELSDDWHAAIRRTYLPMLAERPEAREIAQPLITGAREGGSVNIAPVLSPDGKWVAFLSELDFIDIQLFLANAETGEIIRRLQKGTALDPHFSSLRFINSAGTWSPDASQFAFSALRKGRDVLVILDVERADRVDEIPVPGVDEIMNPSWSPGGESIVFTGLAGGYSDLYRLDLESRETTRLTSDAFAELQPAWSPDGRFIAFSTERGPDTDLALLDYGSYKLAMLEVATGEIELVPGMAGEKNINPVWSADGASLYFVSNRGGIPNVFRVERASGQVFQVTNLFSGVSGYTDISPAITSARATDQLLFTAYEAGGYNIYSMSGAEDLAGAPIPAGNITLAMPDSADASPAVLPPSPRPEERAFNRVASYLADPVSGLPSQQVAAVWEVTGYRPQLGLDYLGQPQVGASVGGPFGGAGLYGAVTGIFSDVLGRHTVFGALQAQGQLDEIGGMVQYVNSRERWNYGGAVQRIPLVYGYLQQGYNAEDNSIRRQIVRARIFDSAVQGFAQYPFSEVQRVEVGAGVRRIATDQQIYETAFDASSGMYLGDRFFDRDGLSLNLVETSASLVYDNALFGFTSPFAGQRYRFSISPTFGDLQYVQALADYRRYVWLRPFTLAVRGLHNARYGQDSEPVRDGVRIFQDQYLGYPWLVRGYYDTYSGCQESRSLESRDCVVLTQLFGSRVGMASAELRFPLIRQLVVGTSMGVPPIEGFVFGDAGVAWGQGERPIFQRLSPGANVDVDPTTGGLTNPSRHIVTSGGVGARVNVFGYIIVEINYVNAFERDRGWHWQFNFQPGF
jgi:Tol biopolymer transport system component